MLSLSVRCVQFLSVRADNVLFTITKLRNIRRLTAARRAYSCLTQNRSRSVLSVGRQKLQVVAQDARRQTRFAANTIMPHFKEFRFMDYDIIGFDLDGTLLRYNLNNMAPLEFKLLVKYLVEQKNYPKTMLEKPFMADFVQKGLIIDAERGNVLKLASDGTILKAAHGSEFLNNDQISEVYGSCRQWNVSQEYMKDPLSAWNGPVAEKLRTLLDYFDIASSLVFAYAVDALDAEAGAGLDLAKCDYKIWPDILSGLIQIYTREHFGTGRSPYFEALKGSPDKYIKKSHNNVIERLRELKAAGKALYLLTGSHIDFANFTASHALGPNWQDFFHCVISFAKKPGFFNMQRNFLRVEGLDEVAGSEIPLCNDILLQGNSFSQGNWQQLKISLSKHILKKDAAETRCLYVGDNLIQDIYAPHTVSSMDTIALCEELLEYDNSYEYKDIVHSSLWGSYFNVECRSTYWSAIIEKYSQLCVPHIEILANVPAKDKLHCDNNKGYYPTLPQTPLA